MTATRWDELRRLSLFCCALLRVLVQACTAAEAADRPADAGLACGSQDVAPEAGYVLRSWRGEDGLPQNWVDCIAQARDGYLWVGTRAGLSRFDGLRFVSVGEPHSASMGGDSCKGLAEDRDGHLWVATKQGVLRLGEGRLRRYTSEDGLGGDETTSVCASGGGGVWVGTGGGLSRIRGDRVTLYRHPEWDRQFVYSVWEDRKGQVWVGSFYGLHRVDAATGHFTEVWSTVGKSPWHGHDIVYCLRDDREGSLWFGTGHGLYRWRDGSAERVGVQGDGNAVGVKAIFEDHLGALWVVAGSRLNRLDSSGQVVPFDPGWNVDLEVNGLVEDQEGNLWVGTRTSGLYRLKPKRARTLTVRDGLAHNLVWSVSEGRDGRLWVGTGAGVNEWKDGRLSILPNDLEVPAVGFRAVLEESRGHVWLGSVQNGLYCLIRHGSSWHCYDAPAGHHQVLALCQRANGEIWVGAKGALTRFIPGDKPFVDARGRVVRLPFSFVWTYGPGYVSRLFEGRAWRYQDGVLVTRRGDDVRNAVGSELKDFMGEDWTVLLPRGELTHYDVQVLLEDREGSVWIGTGGGGLNRWRENEFTAFTRSDGLAGDRVTALLEDATGALWIGTTEGLSRLKAGRMSTVTTRHGLFSNLINQLVADDRGHLWIGCSRGIFRTSFLELDRVAEGQADSMDCLVLREADGLLSSETTGEGHPTACRTHDGRLWFPTIEGLVMIDPDRIESDQIALPVVIEEVRANNETLIATGIPGVSGDRLRRADSGAGAAGFASASSRFARSAESRGVRLPPGSGRFIEVRYTANCLGAPERIRFQYRLEGHDRDWVQAEDRRVAHYTNLQPGAYRFQVRAANAHGVWQPCGATLAFSVAPFFWQTVWFRGGSAAGLVGMVVLIGWRVIRVRERILRLEREKALADERERIARDMHDDIGSRLNQIALLAAMTDRPASAASDSRTPGSTLARVAQEAASCLDEIVWAVQPGKDDLRHLAQYLGQYADEYIALTSVLLEIDFPPEIAPWPLTAAQRHALFLVAKEALHNVVRHARATQVTLRLRILQEEFLIEIVDNGCGIAPLVRSSTFGAEALHEGRGLANMRRRAEEAGVVSRFTPNPGGAHGLPSRRRCRVSDPPDVEAA